MAKRKPFLYGLGSGLIAGALLLQLASIGSGESLMTPEKLEAAATANGYVLKDARTAWYSEEELRERIAAAEERARREAAENAAAAAGNEAAPAGGAAESGASGASGGSEPASGAGGSSGSEAGESGPSKMIYAFTIAPGSDMTTIARLLYELGLIDDYNGFLIEMKERGLTRKVQAKHYRFDSVPTLDELIEELTAS